jgi:hypothetical protein
MSATMRPLIVGCVLAFLCLGLFSFRFVCDLPDFQEEFRSARLAEIRRDTLTRLDARDQVVRELIDQRCTLAKAIELFLKLDQPWADLAPQLPDGQSPREKSYHYIRSMVEDKLQAYPKRGSIVLRRLEQAYEKLRTERRSLSAAMEEPADPSPSSTRP